MSYPEIEHAEGTVIVPCNKLNLTKGEAHAVAEHIDMTLIQQIRNDTDIDSMQWLRAMIHAYEKLCAYSGYVGVTESESEE